MLIVHNTLHRQHAGRHEMFRGRLVPCHESPDRLDHLLAVLARRPVGEMVEPAAEHLDEALLAQVHSPRYLQFLAGAWDE